ncbi:MAG TPA: hypothetical protein P5121_27230 [Caldilineaceae bacterium]|nr:hypothetical protein [Caldilineaceae bacterium]
MAFIHGVATGSGDNNFAQSRLRIPMQQYDPTAALPGQPKICS